MDFKKVFKGRRVLVTGHTGFKGSWLSLWLLKLGAKVTGVSLYVPSTPSNYEVIGLKEKIEDCTADIRNIDEIKNIFSKSEPEIIFHLAAQPIVRKSYDDPKTTFDTNLGGTVNVLESIRSSPFVKAAIIITSDKCYENINWEYGYRETDRLGGVDPYSASKACAEIAFSTYVKSYFSKKDYPKMVSARAGNVIGGGDWAKDRIIPDCIRAWSAKKKVELRNPHATRPWQHVLEPLSGYLTLAAALYTNIEGISGESFNFGPQSDANQSVLMVVKEMVKTWKRGMWILEKNADEKKTEASLLKLCCDKALHRLSWLPVLNFEEAIRLTTEWYITYYEKNTDMRAFSLNQIGYYEKLAAKRGRIWAK